MTEFRITCTEQVPGNRKSRRAQIVAVKTADHYGDAPRHWTVKEVIERIDRGDVFYVQREPQGTRADVRVVGGRIQTEPDGIAENNLDSLPRCS